jgi:ParB family chromosome partitioning protein
MIDGQGLTRLAESIRAEGVIQPIFVRKKGHGRFEIVAGERRWHAAKIAGLRQIPTVVGNVSDEAALAIALIENLHREDLNAIDQAQAMQRLVNDFGMTHQKVAETIGRSRAAVSNLIRLLELPEAVRNMVAGGELDVGHARALLALPSGEREAMAAHVAERRLSVRDVEAIVKRAQGSRRAAPSSERALVSPAVQPALEAGSAVRDVAGVAQAAMRAVAAQEAASKDRVSVRNRSDGSYCVSFSYKRRGELDDAIGELRALSEKMPDDR